MFHSPTDAVPQFLQKIEIHTRQVVVHQMSPSKQQNAMQTREVSRLSPKESFTNREDTMSKKKT